MQKITMYIKEDCPHCVRALGWIYELCEESPEYRGVPLVLIDEDKNPEVAERADYYYVPTFFIGNEKLHEGIASKEKIKDIFDRALSG